jgi:hypothetical protein
MSAGRRRSGNNTAGTSTEDQALNQIASEVLCYDMLWILCRVLYKILAFCVQTINPMYKHVLCERQSIIKTSRNVHFSVLRRCQLYSLARVYRKRIREQFLKHAICEYFAVMVRSWQLKLVRLWFYFYSTVHGWSYTSRSLVFKQWY